jgi:predicted small lipoprotein YifL
MRVLIRSAALLATAVSLAACGGAAPTALPMRAAAANVSSSTPGTPVAGSRAEAVALARLLLSRLDLPAGARRLPQPLPLLLQPSLFGVVADGIAVHQLFLLSQPMDAAAAIMAEHVPAAASLIGNGQQSLNGAPSYAITYVVRSVPAGVYAAQLAIIIAPTARGRSLMSATAQVIWYPARSAAEYIDPATYHVLRIAATIWNPQLHTIHEMITSPTVITQFAEALNRSQAAPDLLPFLCPPDDVTYQLAFAVSRQAAPVVVVTFERCPWTRITVGGRMQPQLQNSATLLAIAARLLGLKPRA